MARRRLELEGKESAERAAPAEAERDTTCHEAAMARLEAEAAFNARAQRETELARVQSALAVADSASLKAKSECKVAEEALAMAGEACTKAKEENSCMMSKLLSLVRELGTVKDEFSAFREKAVADRESMETEFDASGDALFNYMSRPSDPGLTRLADPNRSPGRETIYTIYYTVLGLLLT